MTRGEGAERGRASAGGPEETSSRREGAFRRAAAGLAPPDQTAAAQAGEHLGRLTKPPGSLGRLEELAVQLAAIGGASPPPLPRPAAVAVFAGDHGVLAEGVSPWPQEVTAQMVANFCAGGAAINVLARQVGARVVVVDVGVATEIPEVATPVGQDGGPGESGQWGGDVGGRLIRARVAPGTANLADGPAMTSHQVDAALEIGAWVAADLVGAGAGCLVTGDMGIANTTSAAALIAALTGRPAAEVTGRGTGIDDARLALKVGVVERALRRVGPAPAPERALAELGGLEIAALVGFIVGGAAARCPVIIDGVIAGAALLVAATRWPEVLPFVIAGHRSVEPGASAVLAHLGLEPLVDLGFRLGEGTGACMAVPVVEAAARIMLEMATFSSAGVSSTDGGGPTGVSSTDGGAPAGVSPAGGGVPAGDAAESDAAAPHGPLGGRRTTAEPEIAAGRPSVMTPELRTIADATKGFMPDAEGAALHHAGLVAAGEGLGPLLEVGAYCGKSALWLGAAARNGGTVLFSLDHHRGSEENQAGWDFHDPDLVDRATGRMDTLPFWRQTMAAAGLEAAVVAVVGDSARVGAAWGSPLGLLFIDGGHGDDVVRSDEAAWIHHVAPGGLLAIHDVFPNPADGGRPPYELYQRVLGTGSFIEQHDLGEGSLRVLRRRRQPGSSPPLGRA